MTPTNHSKLTQKTVNGEKSIGRKLLYLPHTNQLRKMCNNFIETSIFVLEYTGH